MNENLTDETQTEGAEGTQPTDTETNQETPTPTDPAAQPPTAPTEPTVETQTEGAGRTLAGALVALHPVKKQRLYSEIDGIVRQGGMKIDTVLHLIGTAIQRELDA